MLKTKILFNAKSERLAYHMTYLLYLLCCCHAFLAKCLLAQFLYAHTLTERPIFCWTWNYKIDETENRLHESTVHGTFNKLRNFCIEIISDKQICYIIPFCTFVDLINSLNIRPQSTLYEFVSMFYSPI